MKSAINSISAGKKSAARSAAVKSTPSVKNGIKQDNRDGAADENFLKTLTPDTRRLVRALWKLHSAA